MNTGFGRRALSAEGKPVEHDDPYQLKGLMPDLAAERIVKALISRQSELILAPLLYRFAIFLRWLFPDLYFWLAYRRAIKEKLTSIRNSENV